MREANKPKGFYRIETYGCQMNVYDSEVLSGIWKIWVIFRRLKKKRAISYAQHLRCKAKSGRKVFSRLGRLRALKTKPNMLIILWGCMAQQNVLLKKSGKGLALSIWLPGLIPWGASPNCWKSTSFSSNGSGHRGRGGKRRGSD